MSNVKNLIPVSKLSFNTSRSGGKGGQNVNKVETRVELVYNIFETSLLTDEQKTAIMQKWKNRIDTKGNFRICSSTHRTQLKNKEHVIRKFYVMLEKAFEKKKPRKETKPGKAVIEKRLKDKKLTSVRKTVRREKIEID